ncbi:phosphate/phosphite/phosphonate ABC transporter substrate-binding protein [Corallincola platygyrae]|uniref:Phosphate/phosphite/phosphonate ABC transporter substrate-binding protein n=1 Tax=Corallincola platygyrae TaxID=1193278 RepID=A0ABW4XQ05_9GAMM
MKFCKGLICGLLWLVAWPCFSDMPEPNQITISVLDFRGEEEALQRWLPLAKKIENTLGVRVDLSALRHKQQVKLASESHIIISNPIVTSEISAQLPDYRVIATLNSPSQGPRFGGNILVSEESEIRTLEQLKGRVIGVVNQQSSAGGFVFQAYELIQLGWSPLNEYVELVSLHNQYAILERLEKGQIDAGFVRNNILDETEDFEASKFRMLMRQDYACTAATTPLYPHWGVTVSNRLSKQQQQKLQTMLLQLTADNIAARRANILGFIAPLDYTQVHALLEKVLPHKHHY